MNNIQKLFDRKPADVLNIYFTAGFPGLNDTGVIIDALEKSGVDLVEIGMPYSDPLADGPTIQKSSSVALQNGFSLSLLFEQLEAIKKDSRVPIILMGYYNQIFQFGDRAFFDRCAEVGVDGLIVPDMPLEVFEKSYQAIYREKNIASIFLVTPRTSTDRIYKIDELSNGFVYVVSDSSITGRNKELSLDQIEYFKRIKNMDLKNPILIGFGISDRGKYLEACKYANGAIIGSAFIRHLENASNVAAASSDFVEEILNKKALV